MNKSKVGLKIRNKGGLNAAHTNMQKFPASGRDTPERTHFTKLSTAVPVTSTIRT